MRRHNFSQQEVYLLALGEVVHDLRLNKGLSQQDLADLATVHPHLRQRHRTRRSKSHRHYNYSHRGCSRHTDFENVLHGRRSSRFLKASEPWLLRPEQ